ncbi:hypothetical protein B0T24DRAFT_295833 [Lasiosphaeria ovina]|uniref:Uncharacterized protein n=1 Tax=Lasiosphaeria ovina TaxID=92902 RepID=A0AAE0KE10_9PEZI|nr:hypothetical protein B0T24DRAFT_295833 [Lasiosphaeria ovina]
MALLCKRRQLKKRNQLQKILPQPVLSPQHRRERLNASPIRPRHPVLKYVIAPIPMPMPMPIPISYLCICSLIVSHQGACAACPVRPVFISPTESNSCCCVLPFPYLFSLASMFPQMRSVVNKRRKKESKRVQYRNKQGKGAKAQNQHTRS